MRVLPQGSFAGLLALSLGALLSACGGDTLTRPTDLPLTDYPSGQEIRVTLVMQRCRLSCDSYAESTCDVSVNESDRVIRVSPRVEVERVGEGPCSQACGGAPVLAHCTVGPLAAGSWTVESSEGLFARPIDVR